MKNGVLKDLKALRATVPNKDDQKKLDDVIQELTDSLNPSLWSGQLRLNPKQGKQVFEEEKQAVQKLMELIKDKKSTIDKAYYNASSTA